LLLRPISYPAKDPLDATGLAKRELRGRHGGRADGLCRSAGIPAPENQRHRQDRGSEPAGCFEDAGG